MQLRDAAFLVLLGLHVWGGNVLSGAVGIFLDLWAALLVGTALLKLTWRWLDLLTDLAHKMNRAGMEPLGTGYSLRNLYVGRREMYYWHGWACGLILNTRDADLSREFTFARSQCDYR